MSNETPVDQFLSDKTPQTDPQDRILPAMESAENIPAPIDPDAPASELQAGLTNGVAAASFEELSFADVFALLIWHPVQTASLLIDTLSRPTDTPALDAPIGNGLSAGNANALAMTVDWRSAVKKVAAIDWRTLFPMLFIGGAFFITLLGSISMATANRGEYGDKIPYANVVLVMFGLGLMVFLGMTQSGVITIAALQEKSRRWKMGIAAGGALLIVLSFVVTFTNRMNPELPATPNNGFMPIGSTIMLFGALMMACGSVIVLPMERLLPLDRPKGQVDSESEIRAITPETPQPFELLLISYGLRLVLFFAGILFSLCGWFFNNDNQFTPLGVFCWILSIFCWVFFVNNLSIPLDKWFNSDNIGEKWLGPFRRPINFQLHLSWVVPAVALILIVGASFRFGDLDAYPPDMTSDHVEKLLDAGKIYDGARPIFLPNNGGREVFQMYFLAALKEVTGLPFNFTLLKIATGIEGMIAILLAFWMGRALMGEEDKSLGNLTGVIMAALMATSYWATMLSRLGLRIVLTTLITMALMIFLARALRHNRRIDYIIAGLILGAGMYGYQAVRMLPLVVIVGVGLAILLRARSWRLRQEYAVNFAALVIVSLAVFVPLGNYMLEYPDSFWSRTTGRLFGEPTKEVKNPSTGAIETVAVPTEERIAAFEENFPKLLDNWRRSTLMFNWSGDSAWVTGSTERLAEMDSFAGALFALGLAFLVGRILRRRDPVEWLLPIAIPIMLLPTALSIAYPIEVPSATRASGTLPLAYFVAALALALILREVSRRITWRGVRYAIYGVTILFLVLSAQANAYAYFNVAMADYRDSTFPYHQAGTVLKGFIDSTGAPGNAFMVAFDYWWDHRSLALESGDRFWNNGLFHDNLRQRLLDMIKSNMQPQPGRPFIYQLHPDRQLLFFVKPEDKESIATLQAMFPNGELIEHETFDPQRNFLTYVAQPVGCRWMQDNIGILPDSCTGDLSSQTVPNR